MPTPRLLVVEDEPIIRADLIDRLTDLGYAIFGEVDTGEAALRLVTANELPDLVLLDVNLAGELDGVDTALRLREAHGAGLPIVFLTSNSDTATFRRARAAQPRAFLSKPFRGRDLLNTIDLIVGPPGGEAGATDTSPSPQPAAPAPRAPETTSGEPTTLPEGETTAVLGDRLFLRVRERLVRIMVSDVLYVTAEDYYCRVVTAEREYLVTKTLKKFAAVLPGEPPFLRVHRSYLVNLRQVTEIGEIFVFVGKHQVPVSRSKRAELLERVKNT